MLSPLCEWGTGRDVKGVVRSLASTMLAFQISLQSHYQTREEDIVSGLRLRKELGVGGGVGKKGTSRTWGQGKELAVEKAMSLPRL